MNLNHNDFICKTITGSLNHSNSFFSHFGNVSYHTMKLITIWMLNFIGVGWESGYLDLLLSFLFPYPLLWRVLPPSICCLSWLRVFISPVLFLVLCISAEICMPVRQFPKENPFCMSQSRYTWQSKTHWLIMEGANIDLLLIIVTFLRLHFWSNLSIVF